MNVLIVHNDGTYGGAGFPSDGAASVSIHSLSSDIGIHELGHSLFGLADEYTYGDGNPDQDANCDNAGCSKWSDMIQAGLASCSSGKCRDGSYYSSSTNMMENYDVHSFGPVNQRITCCKYLYHTGVAPGYCSQFNDIGVGLSQYCNGQLWQGRYTNLNLLQHKHFQAPANSTAKNATTYMLEMAEDTQGDQYAFVEEPVAWILKYVPSKDDGDGNWTCERSPEELQSGLYLRGEVMGDYNYTAFTGRHRERVLNGSFVEVQAIQSGQTPRKLFFDTVDIIEVPLDEQGHNDADHVSEVRSSIEVVLRKGEECQVRKSHASSEPAERAA